MEAGDREKGCCGTCRNCSPDPITHDWTCFNEDSDYYGVFTDYNDTCEEYEERG